MPSRLLIWVSIFIGSTIGGIIPDLWGAGMFSYPSLLLSGIGALVGLLPTKYKTTSAWGTSSFDGPLFMTNAIWHLDAWLPVRRRDTLRHFKRSRRCRGRAHRQTSRERWQDHRLHTPGLWRTVPQFGSIRGYLRCKRTRRMNTRDHAGAGAQRRLRRWWGNLNGRSPESSRPHRSQHRPR
jgi:hypothetical protein